MSEKISEVKIKVLFRKADSAVLNKPALVVPNFARYPETADDW